MTATTKTIANTALVTAFADGIGAVISVSELPVFIPTAVCYSRLF